MVKESETILQCGHGQWPLLLWLGRAADSDSKSIHGTPVVAEPARPHLFASNFTHKWVVSETEIFQR